MRESVVESADSAVQSADYWSRPTGNWPSGYGPIGTDMGQTDRHRDRHGDRHSNLNAKWKFPSQIGSSNFMAKSL